MKSIYLIKPYLIEKRWLIFIGFLCLIGVDVLQLFLPRIIKWTIDDLTGFRISLKGLSLYALYIIGIAVMIGIFRGGWYRCFMSTSRRIEEGLRNRLFEHIQTLSASYFEKVKSGDLMAHATNDMLNIRLAVSMGMMTVIDTLLLGSAAIIFMAYINVKLTVIALLPMPVIIIVSRFFSKKMHRMYKSVQGTFSELTEVVREGLAGIRIIKAYNREAEALGKLNQKSEDYVDQGLKLAKVTGSFSPMIAFFSSLSLAIILYFGGHQTILGTITPGDFVAFSSYLGLLTWPMTAIGMVTNMVQRGKASLDRIQTILETQPEIHDLPHAKSIQDLNQHIVFERVSFHKESEKQIPILSEIHLKVEQGMILGIIGPPGAGKTSFLNLLPRFFDVSQGRILIDGTDIRDLKIRELRALISFMPQEPFLFAGTIRENIAFGLENNNGSQEMEIPDSEFIRAAKQAALYDTIKSFPNGFETLVGEKGVVLSGGQKQRVAFARALIRKRPILILDDPVSQVDTETAGEMIRTIRSMAGSRTIFIVSHRLSAVRFADHIITLRDGKILESGTHEQLIQQDTYYARTFRLQEIEEELKAFEVPN